MNVLNEIILIAQFQEIFKNKVMKNHIMPCIWFNNNALEALDYYTEVIPNTSVKKNNGITVEAKIADLDFIAINADSTFKTNPSISFMLVFESKEEVQSVWNKFKVNGNILMPLDKYPFSDYYGWIVDHFGISWQVYLGKLDDVNKQKVIPTLMFCEKQQGKCKPALEFYAKLFKEFELQGTLEYSSEKEMKNQIMHSQCVINNLTIAAMDSGVPQDFTFNEAISFSISCKDQDEIDYYWDKITEFGEESRCGWSKDPFGVSWQIVPYEMDKIMTENSKASTALFKMKKIIIADLINA